MFILRPTKSSLSKPDYLMKKLLVFIFVLGSVLCSTQLRAQSLNLNQPVPAPFPACQCDSLDIVYQISNANFPFGTRFYIEITNDPLQSFANADTLPIVKFRPTGNPGVDTISTGIKTATVIIPCNRPSLANYIRIVADNGEVSDTNIYNILNKTLSEIDTIIGGFENPYTGAADWGFCEGDSVILVAKPFATFFQWKLNNVDIPGETDDTLIVFNSGTYSVDTWVSAQCKTTSEDTLINHFKPRTNISKVTPAPQAYQIDVPGNMTPLDSIEICASDFVTLTGPTAVAGLTYKYEWLADTIDAFGVQHFYRISPGDTFIQATIDTSKIFTNPARIYIRTEDGFCVDTSDAPIYVFWDENPDVELGSIPWPPAFPIPVPGDVCMKDSITLGIVGAQEPNWVYQWQRANTATNPISWVNVTDSISSTMKVDTSLQPVQILSYYRLKITTRTHLDQDLCEVFTPEIRVRWFPEYDLTIPAGQSGVNIVGKDSVVICETDSVIVMGPTSPDSFQLPYTYQWLTDSMDGGSIVVYPLVGSKNQSIKLKTAGRYYLDIDDGICTDRYSHFTLFVDTIANTTISNVPFPTNPGAGTSLNLCIYDSVLLAAADTVFGFNPWNYQWQQLSPGAGWVDMLNDTLPSLQVDTANAMGDTSYFRLSTSYRNQFGITTCGYLGDSIAVQFYQLPVVTFFPGDSLGLCLNDSVLVVAQGNSFTYSWNDGETGASRWISTAGTYSVTGRGENGCERVEDVIIYSQQTQANAGPDVVANSGETIELEGSGGNSYRWFSDKPMDYNDFLSRKIQVSKILPDSILADTITVYMIATGVNGCSGIDSLTIIINNPRGAELIKLENVYNLFTPGAADNINNTWDIRAITDGKACEILIMNRWGSSVYDDKEFQGIWDGNDEGGNPLPDGTYYYILSCDGTVILKSAITILRND